jgi:hypothetical protein
VAQAFQPVRLRLLAHSKNENLWYENVKSILTQRLKGAKEKKQKAGPQKGPALSPRLCVSA